VVAPSYPLFREPQYLLSIANKVVEVSREFSLDIVHAHYAVPHATAAFLAKQVLASTRDGHAPLVVTTLHGTDITLVGNDPSYSEIVAFSIAQSDHVTAVSRSLRDSTYGELGITRDIEVIPNFLDCEVHERQHLPALRARLTDGDPDAKVLVHVSNFRPVKRIDHVMAIFDRVRQQVPARLLLVGDGPDLPLAVRTARERGMSHLIHAVGAQEEVQPLLSVSDVFLLPSKEESFGLAALEAMACGVPVVGARVGGVPEVIEHGVSGFLHDADAVDEMAASTLLLLRDPALHAVMAEAARRRVLDKFSADRIVPMYEAAYERLVAAHRR
jgi:L-malate glycosyltransferase